MREIKFRAWNEKTRHFTKDSDNAYLSRNDNDIIVEQYTGLKDENGKEIYEGDIVKQLVYVLEGKEHITTWVVRWDKTECCFELHYLSGSLFGDSMMSDGDEYEVIGNIHENPELLNPCNSTDLEPLGGE